MKRTSLVLLLLAATTSQAGNIGAKVIYGDDNRKDIYQVTNQTYLNLAQSTVALFSSSDVNDMGNGRVQLKGETFGDAMRLCKEEPFFEQPSGAFCSGFLVADDTMVTAGHCIRTEEACAAVKFVFNFSVYQQGVMPTEVGKDDVYSCKNIIARQEQGNGADFAIVKLDRKVTKFKPLQVNRSGSIAKGAPVTVIGYPAGIPVKVSDGANVRDPSPNGYFVANLDTYGGNSGSAVFNASTGKVEGILVRGEQDYVYKNGCYVSNRCPATGCRGEDVTKISALMQYIPQTL